MTFGPSLEKLREQGLLRVLRVLHGRSGARVTIDGRTLLNFASNNYLGLAGHPAVREAARRAVDEWGAGATGSRLLGGTLALHERLESVLADWKRRPACAVFPSGWHANTGVIPAIAEAGDFVVLDRLAHASLVDGARLSKAKLLVFSHNDPEDLERVLRRLPASGKRWVLTESVFSMDGDAAPLVELVGVAERHGARLYVDEAHATGVFGPEGRGVVCGLGLEGKIDVSMGTLSKALGALGGYVAGSEDLVRWIHNKARSFIYSTALDPAAAGSALAAVEIARSDDSFRRRVLSLSARLRDGLGLKASAGPYPEYERGPIVPWVVGDAGRAVKLSQKLWDEGFYAPAVRPPTVPAGTARLRFSVTADHSEADIDGLLETLRKL